MPLSCGVSRGGRISARNRPHHRWFIKGLRRRCGLYGGLYRRRLRLQLRRLMSSRRAYSKIIRLAGLSCLTHVFRSSTASHVLKCTPSVALIVEYAPSKRDVGAGGSGGSEPGVDGCRAGPAPMLDIGSSPDVPYRANEPVLLSVGGQGGGARFTST